MVCSLLTRGRDGMLVSTATGVCCAVLLICGCGSGEDYQTVTTQDAERAEAHADHDHDHHHEAPHGGHLIELGEHQYNAEVVLEAEPKQLVVYLLDAHAENAVAIDSATIAFLRDGAEPIELTAQPQDGDAEGTASRFVVSGGVVDGLADLEGLQGHLTVTIAGSEFSGNLSHEHDHGHEHHGHPAAD